ncbi:MAG: lipoyl(octanoyl) transferase LipB [Gammaproteobacteria bacterium]|nr:lipoyl(octanoyl) transferase LipB [Gammaproteobacteria bacterium]MCP5136634.1 lipoyl(octanoyl) transferase LipB [Gammaproteobacteria bacterium]
MSVLAARELGWRDLGLADYLPVWHAMQSLTDHRDAHTPDELWQVQHPPVFTQGLNGKPEHLLAPGDIPVIPIDRGGQVTYHGPGQIVLYPLLDLRRAKLGVRDLVTVMEAAVIATLASYGITAVARADAPGVYVEGAKVASLGLRVRRGCSYHGLALNVNMDLAPFQRINPCGYADMAVTRMHDLGIDDPLEVIAARLRGNLADRLGYTAAPEPIADRLPEPSLSDV